MKLGATRATAGAAGGPQHNSIFSGPLAPRRPDAYEEEDADSQDAFGEPRELGQVRRPIARSFTAELRLAPSEGRPWDRQRSPMDAQRVGILRSNSSTSALSGLLRTNSRLGRGGGGLQREGTHESFGNLSTLSSLSWTSKLRWVTGGESTSTSDVTACRPPFQRRPELLEVWKSLVPDNRAFTGTFSTPGASAPLPPWRGVLMLLGLGSTSGATLLLLSEMMGGSPFGTYRALLRAVPYRAPLLSAFALLAFLLHSLDCYGWRPAFRAMAGLFVSNSLALLACLLVDAYPFAPLVAASLYAPAALAAWRFSCAHRCDARQFYAAAAGVFSAVAAAILAAWLAWVLSPRLFDASIDENRWGGPAHARLRASARLHGIGVAYADAVAPGSGTDCAGEAATPGTERSTSTESELACHHWVDVVALLVWSAPVVEAVWLGWLAVFCAFRGRLLVLARAGRSPDSTFFAAAATLLLYGFAVWAGVSLGGPAIADADYAVLAFACAGALCLAVWALCSIVLEDFLEAVAARSYMQTFEPMLVSDYFTSAVLCVVAPLLLAFLALEALCRQLERLFGRDSGGDLLLTGRALRFLRLINDWHWGSILENTVYWLWMFKAVIIFAAQFYAAFLMWLNTNLIEETDFGLVVLAFNLAALVMFLTPTCPVIPVYISAGIVLVSSAMHSTWLGYYGGILFAIAQCTALKLVAVVVQQKLFGEVLGQCLWVQRAVGVHRVGVQALQTILREPGMRPSKVAILCGGPNWTTAVVTGILRLRLRRTLLATLPAALLIAPCVVCGAVLLGEGAPNLFSFTLAAMLAVQGGAMFAAFYLVLLHVTTNRVELARWQPHLEGIYAYARRKDHGDKVYNLCTEWTNLAPAARCLLAAAVVLEVATSHIPFLFPASCFQGFSVAEDFYAPVAQGGLGGDATNLFRPLGAWMMGLSAAALVAFGLYKATVARAMRGVGDGGVADFSGRDKSIPSAAISGFSTPTSFADERQAYTEAPVAIFGLRNSPQCIIEPPLRSSHVRWKGTPHSSLNSGHIVLAVPDGSRKFCRRHGSSSPGRGTR